MTEEAPKTLDELLATSKPLWGRHMPLRRWVYLNLTPTGRAERRAARQYWHRLTPWRDCNEFTTGLCLRCLWWKLTGQHPRALAAHRARLVEVRARLRTPKPDN